MSAGSCFVLIVRDVKPGSLQRHSHLVLLSPEMQNVKVSWQGSQWDFPLLLMDSCSQVSTDGQHPLQPADGQTELHIECPKQP